MNYKTRVLTTDELKLIINTFKQGFLFKGVKYRPNNKISTALLLEANLGIRISDILNLRLDDIVKDGDRYRLNIIELKTSKERSFTVPITIYNFIKLYCLENNIKSKAKIFPITERAVHKHLKTVCDYLNLQNISTHSFRKFFATQIYINNNYDVALVCKLLQHASVQTTQKYIGISEKRIEDALSNHIYLNM